MLIQQLLNISLTGLWYQAYKTLWDREALERVLAFEAAKKSSRSHLQVRKTRLHPSRKFTSAISSVSIEELLELVEELGNLIELKEQTNVFLNSD